MKAIKLITAASIAALAVSVIGVGQAKAEAPLYDNGPTNGTVNGWTINFGFVVSDSFTLASPSTLISAQIGLWENPGDSLTNVDWSIGSAVYGTDLAPQTTAATNDASQYVNGLGFDIDEATFPISATLPAGTYWLTIQNALVASGNPVGWDENEGPSSAFESSIGSLANISVPDTTGSESFQIYGTTSGVPEPASLCMLGLGAAGLLARRRRL